MLGLVGLVLPQSR